MPETVVTHRPQELRYEIAVDGDLAGFAQYTDHQGVRTFFHTEIDDAYEGHGLASTLIRETLDDVRNHGLTIVPQCPFVRAYVAHHPEVVDLLAPGVAVPTAEDDG